MPGRLFANLDVVFDQSYVLKKLNIKTSRMFMKYQS